MHASLGFNSNKIRLNLTEIEWDKNLIKNEFCRRLFAESSSIFSNLQATTKKKSSLTKKEWLLFSRKYRCVIQANYMKLKEFNDKHDIKLNNENRDYCSMFHKIGVIWHLCEMLFIDINQTGILLNQLISWITWHFDDLNDLFNKILSSELPSNHPSYWEIIFKLIFRRELSSVKNLLLLHPDVKNQEFIILIELLEKMPFYTNEQVLYEFYNTWQRWSFECKSIYKSKIITHEQLSQIVGILCGDIKIYKNLKHLFGTWYHLMISMILYTDPTLKEFELTSLMIESIKYFYDSDYQSTFDKIILAAFNYDLVELIKLSCIEFQDNWWFVTHFVDLIYNANELQSHQIDDPINFRNFFLFEYGNTLMSFSDFWNIGLLYFDTSSKLALNYLELNLEHIKIDNEQVAKKILHVAEENKFKNLQKSIYKYLSNKWLNLGRYSAALTWAIKSEDEVLISFICDIFLKHYIKTEEFYDEDLISSLGSMMLKSDRLTFLAKYYEFHQLINCKQLKEASDLLISLIKSKIAPYFFRPKLIMETIPLLEIKESGFNQKHVSNIISALEEFKEDDNYKKMIENYDIQSFNEKEKILNIAISRMMSYPKNFIEF